MIPVLGFATIKKFDLAERLLKSIDYPVEHLVVVNNSGTREWEPWKPELVENLWHIEVPFGLGANGAWNLIIKSTPHAPYWVIPNDDCHFEPSALETIANTVQYNAFNFVQIDTKWSCVIPGEGAIRDAGIWDEIYHPIYFDDNDFERRLVHAGVPIVTLDAKVHHDNSSTLKSGYESKNHVTYGRNQRTLQRKEKSGYYGVHGWSLETRRANSWD